MWRGLNTGESVGLYTGSTTGVYRGERWGLNTGESVGLYRGGLMRLTRVSGSQCVLCVYWYVKGTTSGSVQATDRLLKELREIYRSDNFKHGNLLSLSPAVLSPCQTTSQFNCCGGGFLLSEPFCFVSFLYIDFVFNWTSETCYPIKRAHSNTCASVTKQYKLVPVIEQWCSVAGKVTVLAMRHRLI